MASPVVEHKVPIGAVLYHAREQVACAFVLQWPHPLALLSCTSAGMRWLKAVTTHQHSLGRRQDMPSGRKRYSLLLTSFALYYDREVADRSTALSLRTRVDAL